jgi:hypothetical protein
VYLLLILDFPDLYLDAKLEPVLAAFAVSTVAVGKRRALPVVIRGQTVNETYDTRMQQEASNPQGAFPASLGSFPSWLSAAPGGFRHKSARIGSGRNEAAPAGTVDRPDRRLATLSAASPRAGESSGVRPVVPGRIPPPDHWFPRLTPRARRRDSQRAGVFHRLNEESDIPGHRLVTAPIDLLKKLD